MSAEGEGLTVSSGEALEVAGLPVSWDVDVAVVGGGTHAVAAAAAAADGGASVLLCARRPYLGGDLCAALRLCLEEGQRAEGGLGRRLFAADGRTTPLRVKKTLDAALVEAGVSFRFGCYASEPLRDGEGGVRGFAMVSRARREAVLARVVIDATDRAWFARAAGARSVEWPGGEIRFDRTLVLAGEGGRPRFVTREVRVAMRGRGFREFARAEQAAREATYVPGQLRAADELFHVPPDPIVCRRRASEWREPDADRLEHFRPAGLDGLFVLSGCADVPRPVARRLLRPGGLIATGTAAGRAAARLAGAARDAPGPLVLERGGEPPVIGRYDVVVVGGGTAGAPAAIAAARHGASVLVVEYQPALGGTATLGLIGRPYHGERSGFSAEVPFPDEEHNLEDKMEWYRRAVRETGGEVWFGAMAWGVVARKGVVKGALVATPEGAGTVLADVVIDATGNADLAAHAGAETMYGATEGGRIAMQGAGLPERPLGGDYVNTDYLLVDESDMTDVWRALVGARAAMPEEAFDAGDLLQTRERRRVVGQHVLRYLDHIAGRTYPDSVVLSSSDYDSHGYPNAPFFALMPHTPQSRRANHPAPGGWCFTPYRCLLPRGIDGLLVIGLGISMERDAGALVRMQHDLANQGYAAGVAAAMASRGGVAPGDIDVRRLQRKLVEVGNLPPEVLTQGDCLPLPDASVAGAVRDMAAPERMRACRALAVVLTHCEQALPHLERAYASAAGEVRLLYARVLGFLGARQAVGELVRALQQAQWDEKILQGGMAEYAHLPTPVDALVLALGRTGERRALPAILEKLGELDASSTLSHHRAVALALEDIGDRRAAEPLARLLGKPGMAGHAMLELVTLHREREKRRREGALREIVLARALLRCGDCNGIGRRALEVYRDDLRGLFSRHAAWALSRFAT